MKEHVWYNTDRDELIILDEYDHRITKRDIFM